MERRVVTVLGLVQGVGFRPFAHKLASQLNLRGFIRNQTGSVRIEIEGESEALNQFLDELVCRPPPLARIERMSWEAAAVLGERQFRIEPSCSDASAVFLSADIATCDACLSELLDPVDRRWRYPFVNCTNCGPRLTIITGAPYDRPNTTMADFSMCAACRAEYEDPFDRRFHAQPIACFSCGPKLELLDAQGEPMPTHDPLTLFLGVIRSEQIGALKGLGGYHLACDARSASAVAELRRRKHRDERSFAVMVADVHAAQQLCSINAAERRLLESPRRPIVLLRKHDRICIADEVAPGNPYLGVMLPYTPLHHLVMHELGGTPLVMTSGNRSDEPIAYEDDDATARLEGIADLFLVHNRPIHVRCDDSVTRVVDGKESLVRRSRGYAPEPIPMPLACPRPTLAVGGQLKSTFALGRERCGLMSHHLGDLDHLQALRAFERDICLYEQLFEVRPELIVCDLHPDYAATRYAVERAERDGCELLAVQHHHAHLASCMAEHGLQEPVIGVTFDGTGYGTDGAVWGGEFLVGDCQRYRRAAHLRYVGMPGGEQAIRQPWRMAAAHLIDADSKCDAFTARRPSQDIGMIEVLLERRLNTPLTSSAGRLFDAVAALAGVCDRACYEGQAAMELEWLASATTVSQAYPFETVEKNSGEVEAREYVIDTRPLIRAVARDVQYGAKAHQIARRFHTTVVELIAEVCGKLRESTGLGDVVLSGGVFMNALLTSETVARLRHEQFQVYCHERVPPNDGGLSLGQLAIAAACDTAEAHSSGARLHDADNTDEQGKGKRCALAYPAG